MVHTFSLNSGLWIRLDRSLLHREEQARNLSVSSLVVYGRLQNDLADVERENKLGTGTNSTLALTGAPLGEYAHALLTLRD